MLDEPHHQGEYMQVAGQTFLKIVKKVYGTDNFAEVAPQIFANPKNIIGEGNTKYVFKIDGIEGYVLAVLKDEFDLSRPPVPLKACEIPLPRYNFGQILFENDNGLMVMRKAEGVPHSSEPWVKYSFGVLEGAMSMPKKTAEKALLKICAVSRMPITAFNHMAMQIKYLNEGGLPLDTINPNNILIDPKNKQINIIDVLDGPEFLRQIKSPINGVRNMEAILLDSIMHAEYMKVLSPGEQKLMKYASEVVIEKCQKAAENVGLVSDPSNVRHYFELIIKNDDRKSPITFAFLRNYSEFTSLYKDKLAKDEEIVLNPKRNAKYEKQEVDYLQLKMDMLRAELGDKVGQTADKKTGKITKEHIEIAQRQTFLAKQMMKIRNEK